MIIETTREEAPSSYLTRIVGFSEIRLVDKPYESATFDASGHKWRLVFYPAGKDKEGGKDHISIYARIENVAASEMLMHNWEVKAELKFFIYNHNIKKYSTFQDGSVMSYSKAKNEWGLSQTLPLSKFKDSSNGYINEDACNIGVEIFVIKPIQKIERVVLTHDPPHATFTWKVSDYSKLAAEKYHHSGEFVVGDRNWRIRMMKGEKDKTLSFYVQAMAYLPNAVLSSTYASIKLRVVNQKNSDMHLQKTFWHIYTKESEGGFGRANFMSLDDLTDESRVYIVDDTIVLKTIVLCITKTNLVDYV